MVEELEPLVDAIVGERMHGNVADLRQPFGAASEPLGRLGIVPGVVPNRF
jgi:hypothetical protein